MISREIEVCSVKSVSSRQSGLTKFLFGLYIAAIILLDWWLWSLKLTDLAVLITVTLTLTNSFVVYYRRLWVLWITVLAEACLFFYFWCLAAVAGGY